MKKKFYIKTWGCQVNKYDSSKIEEILCKTCLYEKTSKYYNADILLLNTCSVREKAYDKLFHQLGRWKNLKRYNPNLIIGVGGCVASQDGKNIYKRASFVDIIFGPKTYHYLDSMINDVYYKKSKILNIDLNNSEKFNFFLPSKTKKISAYVSIMEGCSKYCTFCIVPLVRGKEISRNFSDIILEISKLSDQGVKEVILLGQNVNAYSWKLNGKIICNFSQLLRLVNNIKGIKRIRFISSHPVNFTDELINVYRDVKKLVNFLHLPVQSGSDRVLLMMKRLYSILEYKLIIKKLLDVRPNMQISSDFIVGFPGESEKDFLKTLDLVKELNFDLSYSFIYSPRPKTKAFLFTDNISLLEKKNRLFRIQKILQKQSRNITLSMIGSIQKILVEGYFKNYSCNFFGKTENNRIVTFYGIKNLIGTIVNVEIIDFCFYYLIGRLI